MLSRYCFMVSSLVVGHHLHERPPRLFDITTKKPQRPVWYASTPRFTALIAARAVSFTVADAAVVEPHDALDHRHVRGGRRRSAVQEQRHDALLADQVRVEVAPGATAGGRRLGDGAGVTRRLRPLAPPRAR